MKECEQKRNLAFYKRSGEPWTQEQYKAICEYAGCYSYAILMAVPHRKYIFDDGDCRAGVEYMYDWTEQQDHFNFKNCKQVAYEDIFNEDGTVKGEQMKEEVVTVKNKGELIDLLRSGWKWTSDEFIFPDEEYCIYDESHLNPFRFISKDGDNYTMKEAWNIKTWRKVKPKFKKYDVVLCWFKGAKGAIIDVWNETGVFYGRTDGNTAFDHYEPYTSTVPKHLQDFIDEMKAKEK